jgi:hypothetical protein
MDSQTWSIYFNDEQRAHMQRNPMIESHLAATYLAKDPKELRTDLTWFECLFGVLDGSRDDVSYRK